MPGGARQDHPRQPETNLPVSAKSYRGFPLCHLAALLLAASPAAADADSVTIISGGGAEVQSLETYRKKGTQLYFSYSPLSQNVVPSQRSAPSPYLSGWNHLAPSRYWQKKIGQSPPRHTLGFVSDETRRERHPPSEIDWSKVNPAPAAPQ